MMKTQDDGARLKKQKHGSRKARRPVKAYSDYIYKLKKVCWKMQDYINMYYRLGWVEWSWSQEHSLKVCLVVLWFAWKTWLYLNVSFQLHVFWFMAPSNVDNMETFLDNDPFWVYYIPHHHPTLETMSKHWWKVFAPLTIGDPYKLMLIECLVFAQKVLRRMLWNHIYHILN